MKGAFSFGSSDAVGATSAQRPTADGPLASAPVWLHLTNDLTDLDRLRHALDATATEWGVADDVVCAVELAVEELFVNVVRHGYPPSPPDPPRPIDVRLERCDGGLEIELVDAGRPFDPTALPPPPLDAPLDDRPVGGLGVYLVQRTMDRVAYRRMAGRNHLTLWKRATPSGELFGEAASRG
ncbi:MAG: ATP-binding protein [Planctomycetia bacterium]